MLHVVRLHTKRDSPPHAPKKMASDATSSAADLRPANLARMTQLDSYDYVIVCTGDAKQAEYWQGRLSRMDGQVFRGSKVLAVDESAWKRFSEPAHEKSQPGACSRQRQRSH